MSEKTYTPAQQIKFTTNNFKNALYNYGLSLRLTSIKKYVDKNVEEYKAEMSNTEEYKTIVKVQKFIDDYLAKKLKPHAEVDMYNMLNS